MYVIIVGAGKVGWNLGRELLDKEHEVTLIEKDRNRYLAVEQELEHNVQYGDASELWVLERAGIGRADMVITVTGDDEDNILICQVAKEKYIVDQTIARVNNPRNKQWFDLLGISPVVSATDLILRLIEHEVPKYGLVHLLDLPQERLEIIELLLSEASKVNGRRVGDLELPEGSLLISVLRDGQGVRAGAGNGAGARRRGPRRSRSGDGGGAEGVLRSRRRRATERWRRAGRLPAGREGSRPRIARPSCASGGRTGRSCWWGESRTAVRAAAALEGVSARGEQREDAYVHAVGWYEENGVELMTGTSVMSLDAEARTAKLQARRRWSSGRR